MVSFLAVIVNSVSKQFYRSFSNVNYGGVIGEVTYALRKKDLFAKKYAIRDESFLDLSLIFARKWKKKGFMRKMGLSLLY